VRYEPPTFPAEIRVNKAAGVALASAAVGLAASTAAAVVHHRLLSNPYHASFCDISSTVSCTQVYLSPFGSFAGVPVAAIGAIWFSLVTSLAMAGLVARASIRENVPGYLFVLSVPAFFVMLSLGYVSFALLKAVCLLCVTTYAAVIGLLATSAATNSVPVLAVPGRAVRDLRILLSSPLAMTLLALFVSAAGWSLVILSREEAAVATGTAIPLSDEQRADFERVFASQPRVTLPIPGAGEKVLVVKFNDYQCPPCRRSFEAYKDVFAKYERDSPGAVRLVLEDYPLDGECNENVINGGPHPSACEAAVAVRLSRASGRAEAMEEWLFANQPSLTPALVREAAQQVGGVAGFDASYAETLKLVKADIGVGRRLGVRTTPTFFINGAKIEGGIPAQYFDAAIAYELRRSGASN
jgi:uncharacterized membrane protein